VSVGPRVASHPYEQPTVHGGRSDRTDELPRKGVCAVKYALVESDQGLGESDQARAAQGDVIVRYAHRAQSCAPCKALNPVMRDTRVRAFTDARLSYRSYRVYRASRSVDLRPAAICAASCCDRRGSSRTHASGKSLFRACRVFLAYAGIRRSRGSCTPGRAYDGRRLRRFPHARPPRGSRPAPIGVPTAIALGRVLASARYLRALLISAAPSTPRVRFERARFERAGARAFSLGISALKESTAHVRREK